VYWHAVVNGNPGGVINEAGGVYATGQSLQVRAVATGSTFTAYVNGAAVTTYTSPMFPSGRVGLYDFRNPNHNYDNVVVRGVCATGACCPLVFVSPASTSCCPWRAVEFHADASGTGPMGYQWQVESPASPGQWVDAPEGEYAPLNLTFSGSQTRDCVVTSGTTGGAAVYPSQRVRCVVSNTCGSAASSGAVLVALRCCPDVSEDGNVDQDDIAYLINVISGGENPNGIDPDFNRDGNVDQDDVAALINVVAGGPCP
jgi:hypothetical protein